MSKKQIQKKNDVTPVDLAAIAAIVRAKGHTIGRPYLETIDDNEVHVQRMLHDGRKCICRIRGMSFCVCLESGKPGISTFEPSLFASETGCRIIGHGGVGQMNRP